ncbi:hypothetical protein [Frigoriflavimonas asaccharolytica]|uniref:hypothetical protein n=1 Tax=Frigoriflavimonas asaccharolytica TaxID=2735899 RepID=UPI001D0068B5|nr:hypothetical protein [Frigoriflavimonas asaccharolytica]
MTIVGESYYYADTISHIKRIEKTIIAKTSKKAKIKSNNADGKKATKGKEAKQLQTKTLRTLLYIKDAELQNDLLTRYKFGKFNTIVNCKKFSIKESSFQVNIEDGTFCLEKHKFLNKFFNLQTKVVQWFSLRAPPNYFI